MQTFEVGQLLVGMAGEGRAWQEFLRVGAMSMGVYRLRAGEADGQRPHTEDEAYYVLSGRATFRAGEESVPVQAGTVLYVERLAEHRFVDVTEDLTVLVFFAPAEHSLKPGGPPA